MCLLGAWNRESYLLHGVAKQLAVFRHVDRFPRCGDKLDTIIVEHAFAHQIKRAVETGLTTHSRQKGIGVFFSNDSGDRAPVDWLDIDGIGHLRVGHDRCGIGVHENYAVTLLPECFAGLCAGVIEFTGLPDHDRSGTDDQNTLYVSSFWHRSMLLPVFVLTSWLHTS